MMIADNAEPNNDDLGNRPEAEALLEIGNRLDREREAIAEIVLPLSEAARLALKAIDGLERAGFMQDAEASRVYAAGRYEAMAAVYRKHGFRGHADSYERIAKELRSRKGRRR